ncbi:MAG: putative flagellar system-associated repeat, partial [Actinomycetota bacterium]
MTSSNTLNKIITIGAAALLAISGSLTAATSASAAAATTAPVVSSTALVGNTVSATPAVWASGSATGKWYVCDSFGSAAAATSVPSGCDALYTSRLDTTPFTTTTLTIPSISYCANICTPFGNSSTAFKIRWIEQNGSDISASAAVAIQEGRSLSLQNPTVGGTSVTLGVSNGCNFASSSLSGFADFTLLVGGSARTISSVTTTGGNVVLNFAGALTSGQSISVSYTQATDAVISCGPSAFIRNTTSALTGTVTSGGGGGGGGFSAGTVTTAPTTPVVNAGIASVTQGTWAGAVSLTRSWRLCDTAITATSGSYMASPPQLPPSSNCKY